MCNFYNKQQRETIKIKRAIMNEELSPLNNERNFVDPSICRKLHFFLIHFLINEKC